MIRILIACAGGFSSSALTEKMKKEIINQGIEDQVMVEFTPFTLAPKVFKDYDVIMCCPHLRMKVPKAIEDHYHNDIPVYILPMRMYGTMNITEILAEAIEIVKRFKTNPINPFHFPNEENPMKVMRMKAYINEYPDRKID